MSPHPDLMPPARRMAGLVAAVTDEQLTLPTPCPEYTLGDLIEHVGGLALAFTWAAEKTPPPGDAAGPSGDASRLDPGWRTVIPERLTALAEAWRDPAAWEGSTQAGGVDLPGAVAGAVALNELLVHGWDIARSSGHQYEVGPDEIAASLKLMTPQNGDGGGDGMFGPVVEVPAAAPALDRVIGLSGRDPYWTPR